MDGVDTRLEDTLEDGNEADVRVRVQLLVAAAEVVVDGMFANTLGE